MYKFVICKNDPVKRRDSQRNSSKFKGYSNSNYPIFDRDFYVFVWTRRIFDVNRSIWSVIVEGIVFNSRINNKMLQRIISLPNMIITLRI